MRAAHIPFIVIKLGGEVIDQPHEVALFADECRALAQSGCYRMVVVHGGGKQITELSERFAITPTFTHGVRETSAAEMNIVEMALSGSVNSQLVRLLVARSVPAIGISAISSMLLGGEAAQTNSSGEAVKTNIAGEAAQTDSTGEAAQRRSTNEAVQTDSADGETQIDSADEATRTDSSSETGQTDSIDKEAQTDSTNETAQTSSREGNFTAARAHCNPDLLLELPAHYLPVISPVGYGAGGGRYNINADLAAATIARALEAEALLFLSDVAGVYNRDGEIISKIDRSEYERLTENGTIKGGMRAKVTAYFTALPAAPPQRAHANKAHFAVIGRLQKRGDMLSLLEHRQGTRLR